MFAAEVSVVILNVLPGTKDEFEASDETGGIAVALL